MRDIFRCTLIVGGQQRRNRKKHILWICNKMKIYVQLFLATFVINLISLVLSYEQDSRIVSVKEGQVPGGTWKTKLKWNAYWVKHWEVRKVYVPIWKKVWSPIEVREWLPFPERHPGWKQQ